MFSPLFTASSGRKKQRFCIPLKLVLLCCTVLKAAVRHLGMEEHTRLANLGGGTSAPCDITRDEIMII